MLSLVRISNKGVAREEPEAFFDLADEIGFETKRVLDYGVIKNLNPALVDNYARRLLENYSELISNEDVAFVYGDNSNVSAYYYSYVNTVAVSILNNGVSVNIRQINGRTINAKRIGNDVKVNVRGNDYTFNLKPGQNFYFVLIKDEEDEQFVTVK